MIEFYCMDYFVEVREAAVILGKHYFTVSKETQIACGYRLTREQCLSAATEAIAKHYAGREVEAYSSKPKDRRE